MAVAAAVYLAWLGPDGLVELGRRCLSKAAYAAEALTGLSGVTRAAPGRRRSRSSRCGCPGPVVIDAMVERGFLAGVPAPQAGDDVLVVAVTERRSREEIDGLVADEEVLAS